MSDPKSILITGGASGLGKALAEQAAGRGMRVAIADIHETRGEELCRQLAARNIQSLFIQCDVSKEADVRRTVERVAQRWGTLDVMVNNAGVAGAGLFETLTEDDWHWILEINLLGVVRGCRAAMTPMKRQGHGHIINIASMAGLTPPPGMSSYNVSKAGVVSLSESLRGELAPLNIQVTVVCPSFFKTNLGENLRTSDPVTEARFRKLIDNDDLTATDIAQMIMKAMDKGDFLVLPHREARKAWRAKRWFPEKFYQAMESLGNKFRRL